MWPSDPLTAVITRTDQRRTSGAAFAVPRHGECRAHGAGTAEAFDAVLERSGITEAHLRETVRENLRIRAYIDQRFAGAENQGRRLMLIDEWVAGLRQRADIVDLYAVGR